MNATRKVKLKDITPNLTCKLCSGYLVDATTIIECLHSFCKSCIIKYLEKSADLEEKYCPVCDVQLHSTKPLTSIRSDLMLQEIVYKLVPGLFKNEMSRRRKFHEENSGSVPVNQLDSGQVFDELYITSDDIIHLSLDYVTADVKLRETARRYLKCPAAVSVFILKKFIRGKYDLPTDTNIDLMFGERILPDDFLLMDIAYKYSWTMNGSKPLALSYRIKGIAKSPEIKREITINETPSTEEGSSIAAIQDGSTTPTMNKKKVCKENGSNIMPAPEDVKSNPIKLNGNGILSGGIIIAPIKTPNGKVRGRKRKHLNYSDIVIDGREEGKSIAKRMKLPKQENSPKSLTRPNGMVQTSTQVEADNITSKEPDKEVKEVQLQISENGVMSARSGKDKIILKMETPSSTPSTNDVLNPSPTTSQNLNLKEKLLLSGNFHSKTGPSGVTEIICDKPDPISASAKPSKPGYVTLNIPNPQNALLTQPSFRYRAIYTDADQMKKDSASIQNGDSSTKQGSPSAKLTPKKKSNKIKSTTVEKIKNRIASKGKDGDNVIKAIADLGKLCSSVNGLNATNASNNNTGNQGTQHNTTTVHSVPIMTSLNNNLLQKQIRPKISNVKSTNCGSNNFQLPLSLNFSPASGMSVSMIPCTATNTSTATSTSTSTCSSTSGSSITPPKKLSHQTTVVNGDMKFTTSPKNILPLNLNGESSPKKPPKFFKSRHAMTSPVSSNKPKPATAAGPTPKSETESKRKTPTPNGNLNGHNEPSLKKVKESDQPTAKFPLYLPHPTLPIQCLRDMYESGESLKALSRPVTASDKYSQHLTAMSSLTANSSDSLSSKLGIALDTVCQGSNGNGLSSLGMVPFVSNSYCSMPFQNQRHANPQPALPFELLYPNLAHANFLSLTLPQYATSKSSDAGSEAAHYSQKSSHSPKSEKKKEAATLDLSLTKSSNGSSEAVVSSPQKGSSSSSMLASLLNSASNATGPEGKSESNKIPRKKSKSPLNKISNGDHPPNRSSPTFSPSPKQESNKANGKERSPSNGHSEKDKSHDSNKQLSNGTKDKAPITEIKTNNSQPNRTESKNNGTETQNGTDASKCSSAQVDAKLSSLTAQNNNNPTVSNNYDKSATESSDPAMNGESAKTVNNDKGGVSSSTAFSPKCGSA